MHVLCSLHVVQPFAFRHKYPGHALLDVLEERHVACDVAVFDDAGSVVHQADCLARTFPHDGGGGWIGERSLALPSFLRRTIREQF